MKTFEYTFTAPSSDIQHDMLTTMLAEIGFDSFMDDECGLKAYCSAENRDDVGIENLLSNPVFFDVHLLKVEEMPDKDWNELWEASYQPVVVNERCRVRARSIWSLSRRCRLARPTMRRPRKSSN